MITRFPDQELPEVPIAPSEIIVLGSDVANNVSSGADQDFHTKLGLAVHQ